MVKIKWDLIKQLYDGSETGSINNDSSRGKIISLTRDKYTDRNTQSTRRTKNSKAFISFSREDLSNINNSWLKNALPRNNQNSLYHNQNKLFKSFENIQEEK